MNDPALSQRVLIVAPVGRDAELICAHLEKAGLSCQPCKDIEELCAEIRRGAGALMLTEEALAPREMRELAAALDQQPPWSDVPIIILIGLPSLETRNVTFRELGRRTNVTLVDRPVRIQTLISTARGALRARTRQYEVRDLMEKLEDRVHERDRFLAILGHELRNPLGAILLAAQMTDAEGRVEPQHARMIERQSRHLTRIVNDLLDLSRVVSGKIVIQPQRIDLRQVALQSMQTLEESARAHGVTVELRAPDEALVVDADPVRADQIISNVLSNAIKYTPEGGHVIVSLEREGGEAIIRVEDDGVGIAADPVRADQIISNVLSNAIKYTPEGGHVLVSLEREGGEAIIRVEDNGVGIAADRIGTIFELFAQAENAIGRSQGGMGIGLALVRNLTELHGGSISASSDGVGKGSEFIVRLPIATSDETSADAELPYTASASEPSRRIVIVEDNSDVRELLRLKLKRLGHDVDAFSDGVSGMTAILESRPHLALIDIGLPRLDGYQVAAQVRSRLGEDVILVALSGFGQPEDKRKALEAGFDDHVTKPTDVGDIERLLARHLPRA